MSEDKCCKMKFYVFHLLHVLHIFECIFRVLFTKHSFRIILIEVKMRLIREMNKLSK
jgi:hypothetical protein